MSTLEDERRRLLEAVREAGALAMRHFRGAPRRWHKSPGALVTEVDLAIDRLLFEALAEGRPGDAWLSEERPDDPLRRRSPRVWIVDPLDGTRGFLDGLPEFAISVALLLDGRPVLGAIYNPAREELFEASSDGPALLNDAPVRVSARASLDGASLFAAERRLRPLVERLPAEVRILRCASLAYKLALVACGRVDGLVSLRRSHDWDLAAGALLVERAGGRISDHRGAALAFNRAEPRHDGLLAGPPALHTLLLEKVSDTFSEA